MTNNLLAGSALGLFIGMLIIMVIVVLLFGFLTYMIFVQSKKKPEGADANNVKKMLARRETQLTIEIMNSKDDEAKKSELINRLRRVRSAQQLVDELLEEEKKFNALEDNEEAGKGKKSRPPVNANGNRKTPVRGGMPNRGNPPANRPAGTAPQPARQPVPQPAEQPSEENKESENEPSQQ